jgi:hypothetical protein
VVYVDDDDDDDNNNNNNNNNIHYKLLWRNYQTIINLQVYVGTVY